MLKTVTKNIFDAFAVFTMIVTVFYLAAVTHVMPLPENALRRLGEFSLSVMGVLYTGGSWVIRLFE